MRRTSLHLTKLQRDRLRDASDATGLGVAEIVRRAVDLYLPRVSPPAADIEPGSADVRGPISNPSTNP